MEKTNKRAEGIFSRRAAVNAEGKIRNIGIAEWWKEGEEGYWNLDTGCWAKRKTGGQRNEGRDPQASNSKKALVVFLVRWANPHSARLHCHYGPWHKLGCIAGKDVSANRPLLSGRDVHKP
jgi:hypothetical protein